MSVKKAKAHLEKYGFAERIRTFPVSSATVALAAVALGTEEARIAKTLSFLTSGGPILIVAAGDAKIDNRKYKDSFGEKAKMIPFADVEEQIGHAVGGVCPFGVNEGVRVYLDCSLRRFDTVFPAAGEPNNAVELTIPELELASECVGWLDVTRTEEIA